MSLSALVLAVLVAHPHDEVSNNPFSGLSAVGIQAQACEREFRDAAERVGLRIDSEASESADWLEVLEFMSPSGDTILSVYLIRRGIVGFPRQSAALVAAWWRNRVYSGKPRKKHCRKLAREFTEAYVLFTSDTA